MFAQEIRVCMDIGSKCHSVLVGLSTGEVLERFELQHLPETIDNFFKQLDDYKRSYKLPVVIAMEAYNGHARPIDQYALSKGYRLLNVNNHKLAQFKKIFPGPSKTDAIDVQKMFELFHLQCHLPMSKNVLQEVIAWPQVNMKLKRQTRRRRALVEEKKRTLNRMQADIKAISPGLLDITGSADNIWFLRFISAREDIKQLARLRKTSLEKLKGVGEKYRKVIECWQRQASFSDEADWVGEMITRFKRRN